MFEFVYFCVDVDFEDNFQVTNSSSPVVLSYKIVQT